MWPDGNKHNQVGSGSAGAERRDLQPSTWLTTPPLTSKQQRPLRTCFLAPQKCPMVVCIKLRMFDV
jgi:hypothetical protein